MAILSRTEIIKISTIRKHLSSIGIVGDYFSSENLQGGAVDLSDTIMNILGYQYEPACGMYRRNDEDNSGKRQRRDGGESLR